MASSIKYRPGIQALWTCDEKGHPEEMSFPRNSQSLLISRLELVPPATCHHPETPTVPKKGTRLLAARRIDPIAFI
jgi:hypothetical protein